MPIILKVRVDNPDELLNASAYGTGAVVRAEWSATSDGTYASVGTAALVAGTRIYTIFHAAGTSSLFYRTRYENSGGTVVSDYSDPFQPDEYLVSLDNVKQRLGITATDTASDEDLLQFIGAATQHIHRYTGRYFLPDPVGVYTFDGWDCPNAVTLFVPRGIRSVTTLKIDGVATTNFVLRPSEHDRPDGRPATIIRLHTDAFFTAGTDNIEVTGEFGFAAVPPEVEMVATNMVVRAWQARGAGVATALGTGDFGQMILRWVSPEEKSWLDAYRVWSV